MIGNHVNLAFRIETYTVGGQILISESTFQEIGSSLKINSEKQMKMKGIKTTITVYEVSGITGEYNLFLPKQEEILLPLPKPILIQYMLLDGKSIEDTAYRGKLVKLSTKGAEIQADGMQDNFMPSALTNIKLNLLNENATDMSKDIYAKVLDTSVETGSFYIRFTAKPVHIVPLLEAIYKSLTKI